MGLFKRKPRLGYPVRAIEQSTGMEVYRGVLISDAGGCYTISKATTASEIGSAEERHFFPNICKIEEVPEDSLGIAAALLPPAVDGEQQDT